MADRNQPGTPGGEDQIRALYEQAESTTAKAFETLVAKPSFGALLARSAENVAALTRIGADTADLILRNLRVAGRADVTRLARQLHRTEDKLERVLQEVEALRDDIGRREDEGRREGDGRREESAPPSRSSPRRPAVANGNGRSSRSRSPRSSS